MVTSSKQIQPKIASKNGYFGLFGLFGLLGLHFLSFWPFGPSFLSFGLLGLHPFHFGLLGFHFLSFWPFRPSFPFVILAFWAFISFHFGLLGLPFLSFWPFGPSFPFILVFWAFLSFILAFWAFLSFHFGLLGFHFLSLCFQKGPGPDLPPVLKLAFLGPWLPFLSLCDGSPDLRDGQPLPPETVGDAAGVSHAPAPVLHRGGWLGRPPPTDVVHHVVPHLSGKAAQGKVSHSNKNTFQCTALVEG